MRKRVDKPEQNEEYVPKPGDFLTPLGIELTMMPQRGGIDTLSDYADGYATLVKLALSEARISGFRAAHSDSNCVEIPSKPLRDMPKVKTFYDGVSKVMREFGLAPHSDVCISGGGHIHSGPLTVPQMINAIRDIQNRPYLCWVLDEADDSDKSTFVSDIDGLAPKYVDAATRCNVKPELFCDEYSLREEMKSAFLFYGDPALVCKDWLPDDKSRFMRHDSANNTLEFRMLEAPLTWEEQETHVLFIDKYLRWATKAYEKVHCVTKINKEAQVSAYTLDSATGEFKDFCAMIEIDFNRFERQITENLVARFDRGERR